MPPMRAIVVAATTILRLERVMTRPSAAGRPAPPRRGPVRPDAWRATGAPPVRHGEHPARVATVRRRDTRRARWRCGREPAGAAPPRAGRSVAAGDRKSVV